jgi:uncharacterized protein (DUF1697 family)
MPRHVVLLRGINLVRHNRIAMPELRQALTAAGFGDVATYVASGNVVVTSRASASGVAKQINRIIKERFGFDVTVLVRSAEDLAEVVRRNPLGKVAVDPKRHLVTFLSADLPPDVVARMHAVAGPRELFALAGREVYSWHPEGVGRSPLWERLAGKIPGISATSRNWSTVTALLAMAGGTTDR